MIHEKYMKDITSLINIAKQQNYRINLSIILITLKCNNEELIDIIKYFENQNIEIINEDIELENEEISNEDNENLDAKVTPFDPSKIDIKMDKITIDSIIKRIQNDELEFDSSFQRKSGLWNVKQKSQLIESIFLKIPLPAFYFDASDDDKWQIIDGLQRIGTLKEYVVEKKFGLNGMEFLKDLNGLAFDDLPRALQRRIEETNLNAYLVNPSTPKNVKFNIFKRINTGGLVLEPQEIRNALYQGQATQFILEMSRIEEFIIATDHSIKTDRMLDREFCVRYIAFTQLELGKYNGNLEEFLNNAMEYLSKITEEHYKEIKEDFIRTMKACTNIFGRFAFRRLNTESRRGPVNKALFEVWSIIISKMDNESINELIRNRGEIIEKFTKLCDDYEFQNAIRAADKNSVKTRIDKVNKIVKSILDGEE